MSDYERLSRGEFHPDVLAKAAEQEAFDQQSERAEAEAEVRANSRRLSKRAPQNTTARDYADHTVMRRQEPARRPDEQLGGGAVISRQSALGAAMRRRARADIAAGREAVARSASKQRRYERRQRRAMRRAERRARGGGGGPWPLFVFIAVIVAAYLVVFGPIDRAISFPRQERQGLGSELSWHLPGTPYYVLALGSDARAEDEVSRTDTMILMRVDMLAGKLTMLSIPRDTKVQIEGQGTQKINAAYTFGGLAGAVRAVHELTGVPISQVVMIKFDGVESLVDSLGGVTVDVPVPVNDPSYTGLVLPAGEQEMDGHTALLFSRVRHGFDLGDYQRQKDQRILMEAIMAKALNNPTKLPSLIGNMGEMLNTTMRMYSILPLMMRLRIGATMYQATVPSTSAMEGGVSYEVTDTEAFAKVMEVIESGGDPSTLM